MVAKRSALANTIQSLSFVVALAFAPAAQSGVIGADGGVTLWISWDNLDATGAELNDPITEANSSTTVPGASSCTPTNNARGAQGASNSPASCPATGTCTGRDKISGDIEFLADYIFSASEGAHYLRRVYIADQGRSWETSDVKWNVGGGGSSARSGAWANPDVAMNMRSAFRTCIHDVAHHELGHYFYTLPDRYRDVYDSTNPDDDPYYRGRIDGGDIFNVDINVGDPNTVMSGNFPHRFVDTTNASITVSYDPPGGPAVSNEVLTPDLLTDGDPDNDGPDRAHHGHTMPFASDEWSLLPDRHADMTGVHTEGSFPAPGARPAVDIVFIGDDEPFPGLVLLLDRSGSMSVETDGVPASQFVQEAGMYLYHSSEDDDFVGTYHYNENVDELFEYALYDSANSLAAADFADAQGLTDIAEALETAIDALIAEHGEGAVNGAQIYLMSDGRQTTGDSLWDQVERASERGIIINTFSFGNADTETMDSIANGTSGSNTPVSERDDASELKSLMTRKLSTGRGWTPVYSLKGPLPLNADAITTGAARFQPHTGSFVVPGASRNLQFYAFIDGGDASRDLAFQLVDPSGDVFTASSPNNVARKGRFNGISVNQPEAGVWNYLIAPGNLDARWPPDGPVEVTAYVENRELTSRFWLGDLREDGRVPMHAELSFRYALSDIDARAQLFVGGQNVGSVQLLDDGAGADTQAQDGIYSAFISAGQWRKLINSVDDDADTLRVDVEFTVTNASRPAPLAHYETGYTPARAEADYRNRNSFEFKAWTTGVIKARDFDDSTRPFIEPDGRGPGAPGGDGWRDFGFNIFNARPLESQLRVTLGTDYEVEIDDVSECDQSATQRDYVLCAHVTGRFRPRDSGNDVDPGPMRAQFNDVIVATPDVFGSDDGGDGGSGIPPKTDPHQHDTHCIKLCSDNPYLLWGLVFLLCLIALLLLIIVLRLTFMRVNR